MIAAVVGAGVLSFLLLLVAAVGRSSGRAPRSTDNYLAMVTLGMTMLWLT